MKNNIKENIKKEICLFVEEYSKKSEISTVWGTPISGFADAQSDYIKKLPEIILSTHALPEQVLKGAKTVIAYYVSFTKELAEENKTGTDLASPLWALAYEETNAMFIKLNEHIIKYIEEQGYRAKVAPQSSTFYKNELKSDWSHRHFAYAAGLGTFGINNMLITKKGCCGRYNTIVTDIEVEYDKAVVEEYCLYKKNGSCMICIKNCPVGALTLEGYNRNLCYTILKKNAEVYTDFGSSYKNEDGHGANSRGSQVCGKCVTQSPCAFWQI